MASLSGRLVLIPLESRASRLVVVIVALAAAAGLGTLIARPAIASFLAQRAATIDELRRALAWDPRSPGLHVRLGRVYESLADYENARLHFDAARRFRPTDGYVWLQLALVAARQDDAARAHEALDTALQLDPHNVVIRWEAALLAVRWGERERALEHLRYVLEVDPAQRDAAFQLARVLLRPDENAASVLPREPAGLTNVLAAALNQRDLALAEVAWSRRTALTPAVPDDLGRTYLELLLDAGDGATARRVWPTLVGDGLATRDGNAIWNGGFERGRLLGWGLDWRVERAWGVDVAVDKGVAAAGDRSLRLTFHSFPSLDYTGVSHLVPVEPGRAYRLRALARAQDFVTRSGLKLEIALPKKGRVLAATSAVSGTTPDWIPLEAHVRIPEATSLVVLRVRREPSSLPEGNLGGKVWLDEVRLE